MSKDIFSELPEEPVSYESFKKEILSKKFTINERLCFNKHKSPVEYIDGD